jgi:hypothetical protein
VDPYREYVVLVSRWDNGWDVFVLDPERGLVAATRAVTLADVRWAADLALSELFEVPMRQFNLTVVLR